MTGSEVPNGMHSTFTGYSLTRSLGGLQPMMMGPSSPASPQQYQSIVSKQEPMEQEDGNNCGISRNNASLPISNQENTPYTSATEIEDLRPSTLLSLIGNQNTLIECGERNVASTYMYSTPLTPSNSKPTTSPKNLPIVAPFGSDTEGETKFLTEQTIPTVTERIAQKNCGSTTDNIGSEDPLKSLEMLGGNGFFPSTISPKLSEGSGEDESKSENDQEECKESLRIPKVNSHGKVKVHKCKQCDFVAFNKLDHWKHNKTHIKPEKQLKCPKCPFITEYKHHLEYHINNHLGAKPYKCDQCDYSCVNKSMLNSHLKSHSNIYQYRCANCSYASKYCHSLKQHLRKYKHEPAMVLNPDGTPNPLPIIDVYGTRRGPKIKVHDSKPKEDNIPKPEPSLQNLPYPLSQLLNVPPQLQFPMASYPYFAGFPGPISSALYMHLRNFLMAQQENSENNVDESPSLPNDMVALDLSKPEEYKDRERPASNSDSSDEEEVTTMFSNVEVVENNDTDNTEENVSSRNNNKGDYSCQYCEIDFRDPILYTIHMGYHGYQNPFVCNMCGEQCRDKVSFFLHIARNSHA